MKREEEQRGRTEDEEKRGRTEKNRGANARRCYRSSPAIFPYQASNRRGAELYMRMHAELKGEEWGRIRTATGVGDGARRERTHTQRGTPTRTARGGKRRGHAKPHPTPKTRTPERGWPGPPSPLRGTYRYLRGGVLRLDFHAPLATDHPNQPLVISRC